MKKSERLNQELIFLKYKKSFNIKDLMKEFNISKRTALRDIQELEYMGLSFYVESGRYGKYNILSKELLTPLHFNIEEISSIFFAIKALENLSQTPFDKTYRQIYQKLLATISDEKKQSIKELLEFMRYNSIPTVSNSNFLKKILYAIMNNRLLEVEYEQNAYIQTTIYPYDIFFQDGVWFMNGYDVVSDTWNVYRCDYVISCRDSAKKSIYQSREKAKRSLEEYYIKFHNIHFKCILTEFGKELFLKKKYYDMDLEEIDGTYFLIGNFNTHELHYLTHFLISFSKHIKILYPKLLIDDYTKQLKELLSVYEAEY